MIPHGSCVPVAVRLIANCYACLPLALPYHCSVVIVSVCLSVCLFGLRIIHGSTINLRSADTSPGTNHRDSVNRRDYLTAGLFPGKNFTGRLFIGNYYRLFGTTQLRIYQNDRTNRYAVQGGNSRWFKEPCIRWGRYWRHLAKTIERSAVYTRYRATARTDASAPVGLSASDAVETSTVTLHSCYQKLAPLCDAACRQNPYTTRYCYGSV